MAVPEPNVSYGSNQPTTPKHHLAPGVNVLEMTLSPAEAKVSVGQSARFTPTLKLSNGQTVYDPMLVSWSLGDPLAGTIDDQGIFNPTQPRSTVVRCELQGKVAEAKVVISPAVYSWQQVPSPTQNDLFAARMISRNDAWVAGANGTVLRYFGGQWQPYYGQVAQDATFRAIHFADNAAGWMVGYRGEEAKPSEALAYRYENAQWVATQTGAKGSFHGVAAQTPTQAWAVGGDEAGKVLIMKWNGNSWVRDNTYSGKGHLNAVQMVGSNGWAVGRSGNDALVLQYDGQKWQRATLPMGTGLFEGSELKGLYMINGEQGYAVGWAKPTVGFKKGLVFKFDSRGNHRFQYSNWERVEGADAKTKYLDQVPLNAVAMFGGGQGWMLGATITPKVWLPLNPMNDVYGNLLSFDGTSYGIDNSYYKYNLSSEFLGIHLLPEGDGIVVGRKGYLMQRSYDWRQVGQYPTQNGSGAAVPGTVPNVPDNRYGY
jgi:photosystem II stability/assembly factor-like uncharacterized protein